MLIRLCRGGGGEARGITSAGNGAWPSTPWMWCDSDIHVVCIWLLADAGRSKVMCVGVPLVPVLNVVPVSPCLADDAGWQWC